MSVSKFTKYYPRIAFGFVALLLSFTAIFGVVTILGLAADNTPPPVVVPIPGIIAAAHSSEHSLALHADGTVYVWGSNAHSYNQLGMSGSNKSLPTPLPASTFNNKKIIAIDASDHFGMALDEEGHVWMWACNYRGVQGTNTNNTSPKQIEASRFDNKRIEKISAGDHTAMAIDEDGTLWVWGSNSNGKLGNGLDSGSPSTATSRNNDRTYPGKIEPSRFNNKKIITVATNSNINGGIGDSGHNLAIDEDGNVWAWGQNNSGQLGVGDTNKKLVPTLVNGFGGKRITAISASTHHSMAIDADGSVWAWGLNDAGQLGDNTTQQKNVPTKINPAAFNNIKIKSIAAGDAHSSALDQNGNLWTWGSNANVQLGDGTTENRRIPTIVQYFLSLNIQTITASGSHTMAIGESGSVWAWGKNNFGQIGDGTTTNRSTPALIFTTPTPIYGIAIDVTGTHVFPPENEGYQIRPQARTAKVTNIGNQPTGPLTVSLSGKNASAYEISKTSLPNLQNTSDFDTFTVQPILGLPIGTYTATVLVTGDNNLSAQFDVSFTVMFDGNYGITLSQTEVYVFKNPKEHTVTVTNIGKLPTGDLTIKLVGAAANTYALSITEIPSLVNKGDTATFTIKPNPDHSHSAGTWVATVSVGPAYGNDNPILNQTFDAQLTLGACPCAKYEDSILPLVVIMTILGISILLWRHFSTDPLPKSKTMKAETGIDHGGSYKSIPTPPMPAPVYPPRPPMQQTQQQIQPTYQPTAQPTQYPTQYPRQ